MGNIDLSIIIVNHNSTSLLIDCFNSIRDNINDISYEVIVIDSGSCREEKEKLQELNKYNNVTLILKEDNIGYAKAVNIGLRLLKGNYILITNPDVLYLKNSIKKLIAAFDSLSNCGAVSPKTWWNKEKTFLLPNNDYITPTIILKKSLAEKCDFIKKSILKSWLKKTIYYWKANKPVEVKLASGSCIMTKKNIVDNIGIFDEAFPLYFEDTDWFLRVKKRGYKLYYVPEAEIVHFYNQSAKQNIELSLLKFSKSMEIYLSKHFRIRKFILDCFNKINNNVTFKKAYFSDLGFFKEPFSLGLKNGSEKLLLISPNESMMPSAGSFLDGNYFKLNRSIWNRLSDGRYFVKVFKVSVFKEIDSLSFYKKSNL